MNQNENTKSKTILIIFIILLLLGVGYFLLNQFGIIGGNGGTNSKSELEKRIGDIDYENVYTPTSLFQENNLEMKVTIFGLILTMYDETLSITDDYGNVQLNLENSKGDSLTDGDYALLTGSYENMYFNVDTATKINADEYTQLTKDVLPQMRIEILDYPKSFSHGCEHIEFKLRVKNIGKTTIDYSKFFDYNSGWKFGFQIDEDEPMFGYSIDDETGGVTKDGQGLEDFGIMSPGEQRDLTYYGGGNIMRSDFGTGGFGNIFCGKSDNPSGERTIKFLMGVLKEGSYTEINVGGESKTVTVDVQDCECDLS